MSRKLFTRMSRIVVLIATHDRWCLLQSCLERLQAQNLPGGISACIRVVDNGSTAEAYDALRAYAARPLAVPVEVLRLEVACKSGALNRGLQDLQCDVVAFTDDDMQPPPQWLRAIWEHLQSCDCVGLQGQVQVSLDGPTPLWFTDHCRELLGATTIDARDAPVRGLHGANMAVRTSAIRRTGPFREDLGPRGGRYRSAEDVEWSRRVLAAGGRFCYCPKALSVHVVSARSLSRRALWLRQFEYTRRETIEAVDDLARWPSLPRQFGQLVSALLFRRRSFDGFDYWLEIAQRLGRIVGMGTRCLRGTRAVGPPGG